MIRLQTLILVTILCSLFALEAVGQDLTNVRWVSTDTTVGSVQVVAYWKKGEKKKYRASKVVKKFKGDSLISEQKDFDAIVEFEVSDSTDKSYAMTYRMLENKRDTSHDTLKGLDLWNVKNEDLVLRYETDANGTFESFANRDAIEGKLDEFSQILKKIAQEKLKGEGEKKALASVADKMAGGKALFGSVYETFISQFHNFHGYKTGLNDTLNYQEGIMNPLIGKKINFDCYLYLASLDSLGMARFDVDKYADMSNFANDYMAFLKKTREESGLNPEMVGDSALQNLNMKMHTYMTTTIDLDSGWPVFSNVTRSVAVLREKPEDTEYKDETWELDSDLEDL